MNSDMASGSESISKKKYNNDTDKTNGCLLLDEGNLSQGEESDELFSDTDDRKEVIPFNPNVSKVTDCSSLNLSDTSLLHTICQATTPNTAAVPSTPLSLMPFLTKINEQWSSDLETPQANKVDRWSTDSSAHIIDSIEKIVQKQSTPNVSNFKILESNLESTSPVISSNRVRPRPKRRIFKTSICLDSPTAVLNKQDALPVGTDNDKDISSAEQDLPTGTIMYSMSNCQITKTKTVTTKLHKLDASIEDKNMPTQNFFNDASFSNIDDLCAKDLHKEESHSKVVKNTICKTTNKKSAYDFQNLIDDKTNRKDEMLLPPADHSAVKDKRSIVNRNMKTGVSFVPMSGFATASGKKVLVTESALSKAKLLFASDMESELQSEEVTDEFKDLENINNMGNPEQKRICMSESTRTKSEIIHASEKNLSQSSTSANANDEALSVSKEPQLLLTGQSNFTKHELEKVMLNRRSNLKLYPSSSTFKSASCKSVPILKEISATAKQSNTTEYSEKEKTTRDYPQRTELLARECFSAGVKSITASKEAFSRPFIPACSPEKPVTQINTKTESKFSSFGFSTASGKTVAISKEALTKASALFANDLDDSECTLLKEGNDDRYALPNLREKRDVSVSMTSTSNSDKCGTSSMVNETGFVQHKNNVDATKVLSGIDHMDKENNSRKSCFKWGNPLTNASRRTLGKAGKPFTDLKFNNAVQSNSTETLQTNFNVTDKKNTHTPPIPSHNTIASSDEACSKAQQSLFVKTDCNTSKDNDQLIYKRKISNVNNDTPPSKCYVSTVKKSRYGNEIHSRNLFNEQFCSMAAYETKINTSPLTPPVGSENTYQELSDNANIMISQKKTIDNNGTFVSCEILASAAALLTDEKGVTNQDDWNFPIENDVQEDDPNAPSSPVIGRRPTTVKRTSTGKRKARRSLDENYSSIQKTISKQETTNDTVNIRKLSQSGHKLENGKICKSTLSHVQQSTEVIKNNVSEEAKNADPAEKKQKLEKDEKKCNGPATDFGDTQMMIDFIIESENISHKRAIAASDQDKMISLKKLCKPRPTISKLLFYKQSNNNIRITWKMLTKGSAPIPRGYKELIDQKISSDVLEITAATAAMYKFCCADFYGQDVVQSNVTGIEVDDGAKIILDENGCAGIVEIKRAFLASPGVDPNLLPTGWVENHYRWIVWKLASMDRMKFCTVDLPRALTPSRVLGQLKYRYDREIDRSQRSAIRRIVEKDDSSSRRMVLCVSSVSKTTLTDYANTSGNNESPKTFPVPWKLSLTDGWYSISAKIDHDMIRNIASGKVREGTKLVTYGAELLNCDEGCSPLEISDSVCLKIHTNSTRRARWDTRLGYVPQAGPLHVKLRSITPNGGFVGKITVVVARVYPLSYCERTTTGECIYRNARSEEKASLAYETECRSKVEAFYAEAEKYFNAGKKTGSSQPDSMDLLAMEWNEDCEKLSKEEYRSRQQQEELLNECRMKQEEFRRKLESRLHESLPPQRNVTPLLKMRIVDEDTSAILSVWSPHEDIGNIVTEGNCISVCNVTTSGRRGEYKVGELRLTAGRNAVFSREVTSNVSYKERTFTPFHSIVSPTFSPAFRELDTVGIIVSMENEPHGMKNFQVVHLAYPHEDLSFSSYLSILFWQGVTAYGYTEILTVGSFVGCTNLEYRGSTSWSKSVAYCTERTVFSRNPRQKHLLQEFHNLKELILEPAAYVTKCAAEILREFQKNISIRAQSQKTPNSYNKERDVVLSNNQECETPKSLGIRRRIERLECYGEAPPLSPITLKNSSKRVFLDFQSPVRKENVSKVGKMSVNNNKIDSTRNST
ncbi:hypothetical protein KM043_017189 [Ampulex compressa]|nr:hypothetical protein KM043_017189 [Ampulex compressa]